MYDNVAYICFIAIPFVSFMSSDIQENMDCVEKHKLCFSIEGSGTISHFTMRHLESAIDKRWTFSVTSA